MRVAVLGVLLLLGAAAAGYAYFAIRTSGAPAPASLGEAPEPGGGDSDLDGDWVLANPDGGFAGYRVREVLGIVPAPNDAVGRTTDVQARLRIAGGHIESAVVSADLRTLRSDEEGRDPAAQMALATEQFPRGEFRLTTPIDLQSPEIGEELEVEATGVLRLRGISRQVQGPLQVRWNGDTFQMAGHVEIRRKDFQLEFPQQLGLRVSDSAQIEVQLTFVHPGSGVGATAPPPGTEEDPGSEEREPIARGRGRLLVALIGDDGRTQTLYAVNLDGSQLARLTKPARKSGFWTVDSHPVSSPGGRLVVFVRQLESLQISQAPELYTVRADGSGLRHLIDANGNRARGISPTLSANGRMVAWLEGALDAGSIQVMNLDGSSSQSATDGLRPDESPALSPDGGRVAFSSFTDKGNGDIFVADTDGSSRKRVTTGPEYDLTPAWSPDGRKIAFCRDGDVYVMAPDGSRLRRLTSGSARDSAPSWSFDGRRLAFMRSNETGSTQPGPSRVIVMAADGSRERRVRLPSEAFWPAWLP
jgi:polyisoprenoid-binding protein YceI